MNGPEPHVVIIGAGFGGLTAARALAGARVRVTLLDRRNHHLFQPLLYQVATAGLNPADIAVPIRRIVRRQRNARVLLACATGVDVAGKRVLLLDGCLTYDFLIVATGATHSYFGHDEWAAAAPGLKTVEDALEIRRRVFLAYEAAERETDPGRQRAWLTFLVVGGGPTGVELAGALAEIARRVLPGDFRRIDPRASRIVLAEAGPRILASFAPPMSRRAETLLHRLGVEVRTGRPVTAIDADGADFDGERLAARTVLWAAGVRASSLGRSLGTPLDRAGRVVVNPDLSVPGAPDVLVIGDLAALQQDGRPVPGVAAAAKQAGKHAARSVLDRIAGRPTAAFRYRDEGSMATIGRAAAIVERGRLRLAGLAAWILWLVVHIYFLIGFRNRLLVLINWIWLYLRFEGGARLITGDVRALLGRFVADECGEASRPERGAGL